MLPRLARVTPPALAAAFWALAIWASWGDSRPDGDDYLTVALAVVTSLWALLDYYYRRLTRERHEELAGHDLGVLAEGVAAYMLQQADGGTGQQRPANPRLPAAAGGSRRRRPAPGRLGATSGRTPPAASR